MSHSEISFSAIRENWPIILTIIAGLAFAFRQEAVIQEHEYRLIALERIVNMSEVVQLAVWKNNIERDIKEIKK